MAFVPVFDGGISVASADVTGDGAADVVAGAGPGELPVVRIFSYDSGTLREVRSFLAYGEEFKGGVRVAAADLTGDGIAEIVTGAGPGGSPHVRIYQPTGRSVELIDEFFAYDDDFTGGVNVAAAAFNGSYAEIVTGAGSGGGPDMRVWRWNGKTLDRSGFYAYDSQFTGGVFVATGNLPTGTERGQTSPSPQPPDRGRAHPPSPSPAMTPGSLLLNPGESMVSASGRYVLIYQNDGNLALYDPSGTPLWSSGTSGSSAGVTVLQGDGNLVVYDAGGDPVWWSGTSAAFGARLVVQDDGRAVIYSTGGNAIWATGEVRVRTTTPATPPISSRRGGSGVMEAGTILHPNDSVTSTDGRYLLLYQSDGNLVLYDEGGAGLWSTGTEGTGPGTATMQGDGNLVVYDRDRNPVWASGTDGFANARLIIQDDGNGVIYESSGIAVWSTNSVR
jgi:hypothetical protein